MAVERAHLKAAISIFFLLSLALSDALPQAQGKILTYDKYLRFQPWYGNTGVSQGFIWSNATETFGATYAEYSWSTTNRTLRWGFRVYRFYYIDADFNYAEDQIGTGTQVIGQRTSGQGMQNTTWLSPKANLTGLDSLEIRFYTSYLIFGSTWSGWASLSEITTSSSSAFLTEPLSMTELSNSTWTINLYTYKDWISSPAKLVSRIYWGNSTYDSHIDNIQLDDGTGGFSRGFVLAFVVGLAVCVILLGIGAKKLRSG